MYKRNNLKYIKELGKIFADRKASEKKEKKNILQNILENIIKKKRIDAEKTYTF